MRGERGENWPKEKGTALARGLGGRLQQFPPEVTASLGGTTRLLLYHGK